MKEKGRQRERNRKSNRNSSVTAFRQPTGLGPVATGSGKRGYHLQAIIRCPHLDLLSAPVTRPVSVTKSNKHPKLITLLPLNPTVSEKHQKNKIKSSPAEQLWGFFLPFFFLPFLHLCLIVTRHMCVHTRSCQKFGCGLQAI